MADARTLVLADAAAALIESFWPGIGDSDSVEVQFVRTFNITAESGPFAPMTGRHVVIFPWSYRASVLTRGAQWRTYTIFVAMVERFVAVDGGPTSPDDSWVRERLSFFEQNIFDVLSNPGLILASAFTPDPEQESTVEIPFDRDRLSESKVFAAWASFNFVESTEWDGTEGVTQ